MGDGTRLAKRHKEEREAMKKRFPAPVCSVVCEAFDTFQTVERIISERVESDVEDFEPDRQLLVLSPSPSEDWEAWAERCEDEPSPTTKAWEALLVLREKLARIGDGEAKTLADSVSGILAAYRKAPETALGFPFDVHLWQVAGWKIDFTGGDRQTTLQKENENMDAALVQPIINATIEHFKTRIRNVGLPSGDLCKYWPDVTSIIRRAGTAKGQDGTDACRGVLDQTLVWLDRTMRADMEQLLAFQRNNDIFRRTFRDPFYDRLIVNLTKRLGDMGADLRGSGFAATSEEHRAQDEKLDRIFNAVQDVGAKVEAVGSKVDSAKESTGAKIEQAMQDSAENIKAQVKESAAEILARRARDRRRDKTPDWSTNELATFESFCLYACGSRDIPDLRTVPGGLSEFFKLYEHWIDEQDDVVKKAMRRVRSEEMLHSLLRAAKYRRDNG